MRNIQPSYLPGTRGEEGQCVLRDGTTAAIRPVREEDAAELSRFFRNMPGDFQANRFMLPDLSRNEFIERITEMDDVYTLVVTRVVEEEERIVAIGTYLRKGAEEAEVSFAVAKEFRGRGIGTILLERLALHAVRNDVFRFRARMSPDNEPMIQVFRDSGFSLQMEEDDEMLEVSLRLEPGEEYLEKSDTRDRIAAAASLKPFFEPNAVAVVGASREPESIGYLELEALVTSRFSGPVYPVNPSADVVRSMRSYDSAADLPQQVDLAIITVPAGVVPSVVEDCAENGVRALVVITAGFAETGEEGRERQNRITEIARKHGMRIVGPNCMGLLNTDPEFSLNASFSPSFPPEGTIAMSSQSGALGLSILSLAEERNLGLSKFVSIGNRADVSTNDLLQYWEEDQRTDVILLYLESFGDPRKFARVARRVSRKKPIVAVKGGRTSAGRRAASSHTASMAGSREAADALFQQTGILRAGDTEEMFDVAAALAHQPLPAGRNAGIVTNAGGPGILAADAFESEQLELPELREPTKEKLRSFLPHEASLTNPVDMIASAGPKEYRKAVRTVMEAENVDMLVAIYIPPNRSQREEVVQAICRGVSDAREAGVTGKPVHLVFISDDPPGRLIETGSESIPTSRYPETAARIFGNLCNYREWIEKPTAGFPAFDDVDPETARDLVESVRTERNGGWLTAGEVRDVLECFSVPVAEGGVAHDADEAVQIADGVGYPVALKISSREIVHKSDVGGVQLDLASPDEVRDAYEDMMDRFSEEQEEKIDGVLVQEMIDEGVEVMIGATRDPQFGHLIGFGLGGVFVEILSDVQFRVSPLTEQDALDMMEEIRGAELLKGYRGKPPVDREALRDALLRLSTMVEHLPEIRELDLNPVFARPEPAGCCVVDARIRIEPAPAAE